MQKDRKNAMESKKQAGRARNTGKAVPITVELPPTLDAAIEEHKAKYGPSKRWIVIKAIEQYLSAYR